MSWYLNLDAYVIGVDDTSWGYFDDEVPLNGEFILNNNRWIYPIIDGTKHGMIFVDEYIRKHHKIKDAKRMKDTDFDVGEACGFVVDNVCIENLWSDLNQWYTFVGEDTYQKIRNFEFYDKDRTIQLPQEIIDYTISKFTLPQVFRNNEQEYSIRFFEDVSYTYVQMKKFFEHPRHDEYVKNIQYVLNEG